MHTVNLIAQHLGEFETPSNTIEGICCITGVRSLCVAKGELIGDSFTDWSLLAAPFSPWVSIDVYRSWKYGYRNEGKKRDFCPERNACWFVSQESFEQVNRQQIRELVLNGSPSAPWAGWVTTSYKKHGSIRSPLNTRKRGIWGFDESKPDCSDGEKVNQWWSILCDFQKKKIGRKSMESRDCPPGVLKSIDLSEWLKFLKWSEDKWQSALYQFLLYLLPSQEELKNENKAD